MFVSSKRFTKKFCEYLREHAKNIIDSEKKFPLRKKELELYQNAAECYFCRKKIIKMFAEDKNHREVIDHCNFTSEYRGTTHSICNLRFNVPNEILAVFHNASSYDYNFIIKGLAKKFEG